MPHRLRPGLAGVAGALVAVLLTGCASDEGSYVGSGDWVQQQSPQPPSIPEPQQPGPPGSGGGQDQPQQPADAVRATGLDQPATIAALPDGTALVGERASGRVTRVFPAKEQPQQPLYVVPGVDGGTGYGLVAMTPSPYYLENGLVYAYITTATDGRVISLNQAGVPKDIVTGLPKAGAAMTFGPDGSLLVATGGSDGEFAGKILTINHWGDPGPAATSGIVMEPGVANPLGLCTDGASVYVVDGGTGGPGAWTGNALYLVSGEAGDSGGITSAMSPLVSYSGAAAGAAGCASNGVVIMAAGTDSQSLAESVIGQDGSVGGDPTLLLTGQYGRLRAIALDPVNGGYWVSTSNRDGAGSPAADDDKVLYILPPQGGGGGGVS